MTRWPYMGSGAAHSGRAFPAPHQTCSKKERRKQRTGSPQRPPQPAHGVGVQRRPGRRLERLLEPPVACSMRPAQPAEPLERSSSVIMRCAPADCPQHNGLLPALARVGSLLDHLDRARLQDLHGPASVEVWTATVFLPYVAEANRVPRHTRLQGARPGAQPLAERPRWRWTSAYSCCAAACAAHGAVAGGWWL